MNKKLICVKEFDRIVGKGKTEGNYVQIDNFQGLKDFIEELNNAKAEDDAYTCFKFGKDKHNTEYITVQNYVGLIQLKDGTQIQILPKIDIPEYKLQKLFIDMLQTLFNFRNKALSFADLETTKNMNIYEVFIKMYIDAVDDLVVHGLKSKYVSKEENSSVLKGKLLFMKNILHNFAHKERMYCQYDDFVHNTSENKIIKTTLLKLQKNTSNSNNLSKINHLLMNFDDVDVSYNYEADFMKVNIDRSMERYEDVLKWSKVFLSNKSFITFSGTSKAKALLFPMESLFESYIGYHVQKVFSKNGCKVKLQEEAKTLFETPKRFRLKPDIKCVFKDGRTILMDTKWKRLENNPSKDYCISQQDMYQMFAYAVRYNVQDVYLLYPKTNEIDNEKIANKNSYTTTAYGNNNINIHIYFVDLISQNISLSIQNLFIYVNQNL